MVAIMLPRDVGREIDTKHMMFKQMQFSSSKTKSSEGVDLEFGISNRQKSVPNPQESTGGRVRQARHVEKQARETQEQAKSSREAAGKHRVSFRRRLTAA